MKAMTVPKTIGSENLCCVPTHWRTSSKQMMQARNNKVPGMSNCLTKSTNLLCRRRAGGEVKQKKMKAAVTPPKGALILG